jgi:hypothetical protein
MNFCSKTFSEIAEAEGEVVFAYHKQNLPKQAWLKKNGSREDPK